VSQHGEITSISAILEGAGWALCRSGAAERSLLEVERRLGRRLPGAFRELQSLEDSGRFLARFSNADHPITPDKLAMPMERWSRYDPLKEDILPFMIENQAVCVWGLRLDAGDDPPVVVEVDSGTPPRWKRCADRFTVWLQSQVQDKNLLDLVMFAAQADPLDAAVLAELRQRFEEGPQTYGWPGTVNYRFFNDDCRLLLWDWDRQCDWSITPRSAELVPAVLDEVEATAGLGRSLYGINDRDRGALQRWRSLRGIQPVTGC